ncbi:hypothetical protein BDV37DRAFT_241511 [Aspergillus pseudonomiae]|uniref:Uncharacterized protein n=1 Tax=Aspergillus pseudonomiae TaxID=1506151 RepID=A0A5N7DLX7_9EURO|nr:uncharacterized protein BDV37DRAFT_241511 [Aspergillus pseudonomiae]KAE8407315.1 hypothetical protein BDV37DRAFT_241511 [Aspergillus pseudonomiae]
MAFCVSNRRCILTRTERTSRLMVPRVNQKLIEQQSEGKTPVVVIIHGSTRGWTSSTIIVFLAKRRVGDLSLLVNVNRKAAVFRILLTLLAASQPLEQVTTQYYLQHIIIIIFFSFSFSFLPFSNASF